jgi:HD superfamily phosphohydrolase
VLEHTRRTERAQKQVIREKLYRDPVHDLIALDKNTAEDNTLMELIDCPEMQRLRRIRQMGLANLAYQGAEHSRFSHSLGAMWVATRVLEQLSKEQPVPQRMRFATRCAALLHDVGHGPLSHVFESFMQVHHETWTSRIILDPSSRIYQVLRGYHASLPNEVVNIIQGKSHPRFLSQIISSQLDADRFDYLLRDSIMTGVKYGIYDFERLLHVLRLDSRSENIVVAGNGVQAVEKYLQARYHMYSQVYLHKTVRAGERVFGSLLTRAADLAGDARTLCLQEDDPLLSLLREKGHADLSTYLHLDDHVIYTALHRWTSCKDPVLADLASRITERQLFKTMDVSRVKNLKAKEKLAREEIRKAGLDPRYYFMLDSSGDIPYKPYDPRRPSESSHIMVEQNQVAPGGGTRDIFEVSEVVVGLARAAFTIKRAVFPATAGGVDLREKMSRIFFAAGTAEGFLSDV